MLGRARSLRLTDVEGDRELLKVIRGQIEFLGTGMLHRNRYLGCPPCSFARTGTTAGAAEFLAQVRSHPLEHHDNTTINLIHSFEQPLEEFVRPGVDPPALAEARTVFNLAPLDASRGEGTHREKTFEQQRAPATGSQRLKQAGRTTPSVNTVKQFKRQFGERGNEVIRFEWQHFKRILRPAGNKEWLPVPMSTANFYARVYREDEVAELNWNNIATRMPPPREVVTEKPDNEGTLHNEYLVALYGTWQPL